jgi:hypothetical protein
MRKLVAALVGVSVALLLAQPVEAAKPASTTQVTTSLATSTFDGSTWLMIQGERIQQPGNRIWTITWQRGSGVCGYYNEFGNGPFPYTYVGEWGIQTGATWGPTDYVFAWIGSLSSGYEAQLSLGEAYPNTLGVQWAQRLIEAGCTHGVLYSVASGKSAVVLDDYVPLPTADPRWVV